MPEEKKEGIKEMQVDDFIKNYAASANMMIELASKQKERIAELVGVVAEKNELITTQKDLIASLKEKLNPSQEATPEDGKPA